MNHLSAKSHQAVKAAELRWLVKLYAVSFAVLGAVAPYFALELQARGASGVTLALSLGVLPLVRLVAGPLWGMLADWLQGSKRVLVVGATITFLATAILAYEDLPPRITPLVMALWALGRAPMGPIVDAMALSALGDDQGAYGKLRRWGSVGFLIAAFSSGALRDWFGLSPLVFGWVLSSLVLWIVLDTPKRKTPQRVALLPALVAMGKDRVVRCLLIGSAFHFAGHIGSTSFLAVHMEGLGLSSQWVGVALAVGVGVEVVVLSYSKQIMARIPARWLFLIAVCMAIPRWVLTAIVVNPVGLILLQSMHGITFGVFWLAGVHIIANRAPRGVANSAQGLLAASVGGVGAMMGMVGGSLLLEVAPTRDLFVWGAVSALVATFFAGWVFRFLGQRANQPMDGLAE